MANDHLTDARFALVAIGPHGSAVLRLHTAAGTFWGPLPGRDPSEAVTVHLMTRDGASRSKLIHTVRNEDAGVHFEITDADDLFENLKIERGLSCLK